MNALETVRHIMMLNEVSFKELADRLGYKTTSGVRNRLCGDDIKVGTWKKILNSMGYEVVVRNGNEEYVISDDNLPSDLRFDMPLNFDTILGDKK